MAHTVGKELIYKEWLGAMDDDRMDVIRAAAIYSARYLGYQELKDLQMKVITRFVTCLPSFPLGLVKAFAMLACLLYLTICSNQKNHPS